LPLSDRASAIPRGLLIDWLSREFRARAARHGIDTNPAFAGTYTYREDADFPRIFHPLSRRMPNGGLIMCHPGMSTPNWSGSTRSPPCASGNSLFLQ